MPHSEEASIPEPPEAILLSDSESETSEEDDIYVPEMHDKSLKFFSQKCIDELIKDLNLSKQQSELITSRFKERNLTVGDVRITKYRAMGF